MKLNMVLILAASALAMAGCSSTPTKVDTGKIHARTFNFVNRGSQPPADRIAALHTMIQGAITKDLAAKGVSKVPAGGDVTVGYLLIIGNNGMTTRIDDYFSYGQEAADLQDKAHTAYTESKNPNYFEAGTLVIDIVDSRSFKLLRRNYATRSILRNVDDATRESRIQDAVDEILENLRVAQ